MATVKVSDEALLAFLQSHPHFRDRLASIVGAVGNLDGELGDAAEERLVEEMRLLGREALQGWANDRVETTERNVRSQAGMHRQGKKTLLAYEIRRHRSSGAAMQARNQPRAPLCSGREGQSARMFATVAAGDRGFRGGRSFRPGRVEIARALRFRDRRKHDPTDRSGPCPGDFRDRPAFAGISQRAGPA